MGAAAIPETVTRPSEVLVAQRGMRPPDAVDAAETATRPKVTIVVPCLNEESVIGEFVDWCHEGLRAAGVAGQILIVDSSTDRSPEIAGSHGAEVLRVPRARLGPGLHRRLALLRGDYVLMGDCDLTYDFRELRPFLEKLDAGNEFVMGSRFKGHIEPAPCPAAPLLRHPSHDWHPQLRSTAVASRTSTAA